MHQESSSTKLAKLLSKKFIHSLYYSLFLKIEAIFFLGCAMKLRRFLFSSAHADEHHYGVVEQFVGHGVGRVFHSDPVILHYSNYLELLIQLFLILFT